MKHSLALCFLFIVSTFVFGVEEHEVKYIGGTAEIATDTLGRFNMSGGNTLIFEAGDTRLKIPYSSITSYEYARALKRHFGIAPAIAVSMVRKRKREHFFTISYNDEKGEKRVVVFEVGKRVPRVLAGILKVEAPEACQEEPNKKLRCGP